MDVFLHRACAAKSRSEAAHWCQEGRVRLDGSPVKASHAVRVGQRLELAVGERAHTYVVRELPRSQCSRATRERFLEPA
ncbi:MAG: hypothetical protein HZB25_03835 [Candidatus Eisenbacteria bacterium]|nr:hypothetical protein [Candidatus Eisenbacteria bacterium]